MLFVKNGCIYDNYREKAQKNVNSTEEHICVAPSASFLTQKLAESGTILLRSLEN